MNKSLFGIPCIVARQVKKQKKTSKYKIINWFYKKIYGYEYESMLPKGTNIMYFSGKLYFRDKEIIDSIAKVYYQLGDCEDGYNNYLDNILGK